VGRGADAGVGYPTEQLPESTHAKPTVSNPANEKRVNMVVRASRDECKTWTPGQVLWPGPSAYSDLCTTADGQICCLYERGNKSAYETITFARFGVEWVEDGM